MKALLFAVAVLASGAAARADPLPSWVDGAAKERITAFVDAVTDPENLDCVHSPDRIALFDNDGTLLGQWLDGLPHVEAAVARRGCSRPSSPADGAEPA
jgi:hypothetical protein